jgi:multisubunit Na+/H+ antiporter MnhB subunit
MAIAFPFVFGIEALRSNLTELPGLHLVIYGLLMILIMIYYPNGFAGFYNWIVAKIRARFGRGKAESEDQLPQTEVT